MKQATDWLQDPAALIGSLGKVKVQIQNNISSKITYLILYQHIV